MTDARGDSTGGNRRISRDELDRLFDREMDSAERRDFVARAGRDPRAADEIIDMRRVLGQLRQPIDTPELTDAVLARVQRRRGFLSSDLRRRVRRGRLAAAACVLVGMLGLAVAHRVMPGAMSLRDEPTPVADLGDAVRQDSAQSRLQFADAVMSLAAERHDAHAAPASAARAAAPARAFTSEELIVPETPDSPARYVALRASADAEVLALGDGFENGHCLACPGPTALLVQTQAAEHGPMVELSVAMVAANFDAPAGPPLAAGRDAPPRSAFAIDPGVLPLSAASARANASIHPRDPFLATEVRFGADDLFGANGRFDRASRLGASRLDLRHLRAGERVSPRPADR